MARSKKISRLIADLSNIGNNFNLLLSKELDDIVAELIVSIGKSTAYDTGVVRDIIGDILLDLGRYDLLSEIDYIIYEYWKTRAEREKDNSRYYFGKKKNRSQVRYDISITDYGFANQQDKKVSKIHPRADENVVKNNVNLSMDKMITGSDPNIESAIELFKEKIIKLIERGV